MLIVVEGDDYIWKKLTLNYFKTKWKDSEVIWCSGLSGDWLEAYTQTKNNLILRQVGKFTDRFTKHLKEWREKNIIFEDDLIPTSPFRRKVLRLGKHINCDSNSKELPNKIEKLAIRMGISEVDNSIRYGFSSLSDAYWWLLKKDLGIETTVPKRNRESMAWWILTWNPRLCTLKMSRFVELLGGIANIVRVANEGANKWRLIEECKRVDSSQIVSLFSVAKRLSENKQECNKFISRVIKISKILEDERSVPLEYLYLKVK